MHLMIAFRTTEDEEGYLVEEQIESALSKYEKVQPIAGVWVVRLSWESDRDKIVSDIQTIGQVHRLLFMVSPIMQAGGYQGLLPNEHWQTLNEVSKPMGLFEVLGRGVKPKTPDLSFLGIKTGDEE